MSAPQSPFSIKPHITLSGDGDALDYGKGIALGRSKLVSWRLAGVKIATQNLKFGDVTVRVKTINGREFVHVSTNSLSLYATPVSWAKPYGAIDEINPQCGISIKIKDDGPHIKHKEKTTRDGSPTYQFVRGKDVLTLSRQGVSGIYTMYSPSIWAKTSMINEDLNPEGLQFIGFNYFCFNGVRYRTTFPCSSGCYIDSKKYGKCILIASQRDGKSEFYAVKVKDKEIDSVVSVGVFSHPITVHSSPNPSVIAGVWAFSPDSKKAGAILYAGVGTYELAGVSRWSGGLYVSVRSLPYQWAKVEAQIINEDDLLQVVFNVSGYVDTRRIVYVTPLEVVTQIEIYTYSGSDYMYVTNMSDMEIFRLLKPGGDYTGPNYSTKWFSTKEEVIDTFEFPIAAGYSDGIFNTIDLSLSSHIYVHKQSKLDPDSGSASLDEREAWSFEERKFSAKVTSELSWFPTIEGFDNYKSVYQTPVEFEQRIYDIFGVDFVSKSIGVCFYDVEKFYSNTGFLRKWFMRASLTHNAETHQFDMGEIKVGANYSDHWVRWGGELKGTFAGSLSYGFVFSYSAYAGFPYFEIHGVVATEIESVKNKTFTFCAKYDKKTNSTLFRDASSDFGLVSVPEGFYLRDGYF